MITVHKNGLKLHGFISINTTVLDNPLCRENCKNRDNICAFCYGRYMINRYPRLKKALQKNSDIFKNPLSEKELTDICRIIRSFNRHYIRFHSIGELYNIDHLENFLRICESLPDHHFGLWSKRDDLISKIIEKPENISIVFSNLQIDKPAGKIPKNFDHVFNVMTYKYVAENTTVINCRGRCIDCLKCYNERGHIINELLKADQTRIKKGFLQELNYEV